MGIYSSVPLGPVCLAGNSKSRIIHGAVAVHGAALKGVLFMAASDLAELLDAGAHVGQCLLVSR